MGIGATELKFLLYSKNKFGEFKKVLTLGRQQIGIENFEIKEILKNDCKYKIYDYCEDLLKDYFGASQVDSIDFSDYEGCTYTHDIGEEINLIQKYDTIIDFGTTEHVFNVGQAFKNIHKMLNIKGRVLHSNPANSFNGHGFHQFSHELYYSLYSNKNGYSNTKVFLNDFSNKHKGHWFEINISNSGKRIEYCSKESVGNLVHTEKSSDVEKLNVYQILYDQAWDKNKKNVTEIKKNGMWKLIRKNIKKMPFFFIISFLRKKYHQKFISGIKHFNKHPEIKKISINKLIYR